MILLTKYKTHNRSQWPGQCINQILLTLTPYFKMKVIVDWLNVLTVIVKCQDILICLALYHISVDLNVINLQVLMALSANMFLVLIVWLYTYVYYSMQCCNTPWYQLIFVVLVLLL